MIRRSIILFLIPVLAGCTTVTKTRVTFEPQANTCEVAEVVRPLSTINVGQCWDGRMQSAGTVSGNGKPIADVATDILQAGAIVGAAGIIASGLRSLGTIKTEAVVSGSLDPVTMNAGPVQLLAPVSMPPMQLLAPMAP